MRVQTSQSKQTIFVLVFITVFFTVPILFPPSSSLGENKPHIIKLSAIGTNEGQFWHINLELDQAIGGKHCFIIAR